MSCSNIHEQSTVKKKLLTNKKKIHHIVLIHLKYFKAIPKILEIICVETRNIALLQLRLFGYK